MPSNEPRIKFGNANQERSEQTGQFHPMAGSAANAGYSLEETRRREVIALGQEEKGRQPAVRPWILILVIFALVLFLAALMLGKNRTFGTREANDEVLRQYQQYLKNNPDATLTLEEAREKLNEFAQLKDNRPAGAKEICATLLTKTIGNRDNPLNQFGAKCLRELK